MHHEPLLGFTFEPVHALNIVGGTQRRGNESLCLAALENGRTVRPGQDAGFDPDRADRVEFSFVWTFALAKDIVAEDFFL